MVVGAWYLGADACPPVGGAGLQGLWLQGPRGSRVQCLHTSVWVRSWTLWLARLCLWEAVGSGSFKAVSLLEGCELLISCLA